MQNQEYWKNEMDIGTPEELEINFICPPKEITDKCFPYDYVTLLEIAKSYPDFDQSKDSEIDLRYFLEDRGYIIEAPLVYEQYVTPSTVSSEEDLSKFMFDPEKVGEYAGWKPIEEEKPRRVILNPPRYQEVDISVKPEISESLQANEILEEAARQLKTNPLIWREIPEYKMNYNAIKSAYSKKMHDNEERLKDRISEAKKLYNKYIIDTNAAFKSDFDRKVTAPILFTLCAQTQEDIFCNADTYVPPTEFDQFMIDLGVTISRAIDNTFNPKDVAFLY